MAQLNDDCFAQGDELLPADAALALLRQRLHPVVESETLALRHAGGRILAADVIADRDVPPNDNSAVDGYAVYFNDLDRNHETVLPVAGRAAAGHPLDAPAQRGTAVRIFTGAPMPDAADGGPDTVMMQEDCRREGDQVTIRPGIARGANRRRRGEDVTAGATILETGQRLRAQDVGLAASVGRAELTVFRALRVAVFSTGDEVREPGAAAANGAIYDANRFCLMTLLDGLGCRVSDLGIVADDRTAIAAALETAAHEHDLVITSAGMSTGEEDHLAAVVGEAGQLYFWRLAIKPGRPVALGQIAGTPFIGLPGNPAAMMVTFVRLARPAILRLAGARELEPRLYRVRAGFDHKKKPARREYVRVRLADAPDGIARAEKFPREGAGILTSLVEADGLVELGEDVTQLTAGTMVDFLPFSEVL